MKNSKSFFLISFLPALAYWYLEENYPLRVALGIGLLLALLELAIEKLFTKKVHTISIFNFILILMLGGFSFLGDEGIWFKLQPCITGLAMGVFLFWRLKKGNGLLSEMFLEMNDARSEHIPLFIIQKLEAHLVWLFLLYGSFMGFVAWKLSTDYWIFFKTIGFYIVFFIFMVVEMILLRKKIRQWHTEQARQAYLNNLLKHKN